MPRFSQFVPQDFRDRHRTRWNNVQNVILPVKIAAARVKRKIRPHPFPRLKNGEIYLHLGCGPIDHPKFVNVDAIPAPHIHLVGGVEKLPYFESGSVSLIYASHVLEHISHLETRRVLREWHRVLRTGGVLRLSVPNFDNILEIYEESNREMGSILAILMGGQDYKYNFHKAMFNKESLTQLLKEAGFKEVREWTPGLDELTTFADFSVHAIEVRGRQYPISLNLEAEK